jgi:hypothetical protein
MMKNIFVTLVAMAVVFGAFGAGSTAAAQQRPDLSGFWLSPGADITVALLPGEEISLTPYGAERYKKLDQADSPSYRCLPYGPIRGVSSTWPYIIVQTPNTIAFLIEAVDYRVIYMDGRGHPDDILDYPEWMGHSIGRWEGDTLVIDTIGMRPETWLDTAGLEHSDKLHVIEKIQKTGDTLKWTITIEDPVFFTHPFTFGRTSRRMAKDARMMPGRCADGEGSFENTQHGFQGPEHKNPPKMPK